MPESDPDQTQADQPEPVADPDQTIASQAEDDPRGASSADSSDLPPPTIEGYRISREISRGGQAVVYKGKQKSTGQSVAIKVIHMGPFASTRQRARLDREVQVLGSLHHPNIVSVIDRGVTTDGSDYFVMRFIRGVSLGDWLKKRHDASAAWQPPSERMLQMFHKVCQAINVAHGTGIVHRDLKPSNIRIDPNGEPYVLDFGLAHTSSLESTSENPLTISGQFLGSLPWASPEQADGDPAAITTRTDVYALGVMLYQMVTGSFPYEVVGKMRDVLDNIVRVDPTPPSDVIEARLAKQAQDARRWKAEHGDLINVDLEAIVLKALAKDPADRYANAGELADELTRYLTGKPSEAALAAAANAPRRARSRASKSQPQSMDWRWIAAGLALLIAGAVAATLIIQQFSNDPSDLASNPPQDDQPAPLPPEDAAHDVDAQETDQQTPSTETNAPPPTPTPDTAPTPPDSPEPARHITADEVAGAKRVIELGGSVSINPGGQKISQLDQLPGKPFKVTALWLSNNQNVTNEDLGYFAQADQLSRLYLMRTQIGDEGIAHLAGIKSISLMDIRGTRVTGDALQYMSNFHAMRSLEMLGSPVEDDDLKHIAGLKNLGSVRLSGGAITDAGLRHLKDLNLHDLVLMGSTVTDEGMDIIAGFPRMNFLTLSSAPITDAGLEKLSTLKSVGYLTLDSTAITNEGMAHLATMRGLKQISLVACRIDDEGLAKLHDLKGLMNVSVHYTKVSDEGIEAFKAALPAVAVHK